MKEVKTNKEEQLIDTARSLFINHGIRRITIDKICKTAGISRVTFYKYFPNKNELVIHVFNDLIEKNITLFRRIMSSDTPYHEKFSQIFDLKIQKNREYGPHFLQDVLEADGILRGFITQNNNGAADEKITSNIHAFPLPGLCPERRGDNKTR